MSTRLLALDIKIRGMEALTRELGASGMAHFMQQFSTGYGDYSKDRHQVIDQLKVDDVWTALKKAPARKKRSAVFSKRTAFQRFGSAAVISSCKNRFPARQP